MIKAPTPVIEKHGEVFVVRDDLVPGGSKTRFLPYLIGDATEIVFGGPFCGGAPVALATIGHRLGRKVTVFYAKRKQLHRRQLQVLKLGGTIYQVPFGYMTNVQAKARAYAASVGALFLPLGFDVPAAEEPFIKAMAGVRKKIGDVGEVWCASGSGMLARCLGQAFPNSQIRAVAVGLESRWKKQTMPPNVQIEKADVDFSQECNAPAPFNCCPNYDRKAWVRCAAKGRGPRLFWNVLG